MDNVSGQRAMYGSREVERTLDDEFLTDALRSARSVELKVLGRELLSLSDSFDTPLRIFEIGIGDGHIPLGFDRELWVDVEKYVGIDNSPGELKRCEKNIHAAGLSNKIETFELDAIRLGDISFRRNFFPPFHAILCAYFTAGNFKPDEIELKEDKFGHITRYPAQVLSPNQKFKEIFSGAWELLIDGGKLILGSTYVQSLATRLKQEEFYKKCGMQVITTEKDEFTATREGFWSERFTDEKIRSYLDWIDPKNITFINLDNENFARMIVVEKGSFSKKSK